MDGTGWEDRWGWRYFRPQAAELPQQGLALTHGRHSLLAVKGTAVTAGEILRTSRADRWTVQC